MKYEDDRRELLDLFFRHLLDGAVIPNKYRKKKRRRFIEINKDDVPRIIASTGRAAFSTRVELDGKIFYMSFTQFKSRVWINSDWNVDPPDLEGDAVLNASIRIIEEIRARQFLSLEQIDWLSAADSVTGCLTEIDAIWLRELHHDHNVILPSDVPQAWTLSPFGWEVWRRLQRRSI